MASSKAPEAARCSIQHLSRTSHHMRHAECLNGQVGRQTSRQGSVGYGCGLSSYRGGLTDARRVWEKRQLGTARKARLAA